MLNESNQNNLKKTQVQLFSTRVELGRVDSWITNHIGISIKYIFFVTKEKISIKYIEIRIERV